MQKVFIAPKNYKRIDEFLAKELQISKNQALSLIKEGLVFCQKKEVKKGGLALKEGDEIALLTPKIAPKPLKRELDLEIEVIFEDDDLLVLNKPPNLVVHKAPSVKEPTLVDWLEAKNYQLSNLGSKERYGIVHRLDKDTSGGIVIAKNNFTHVYLSEQLKTKTMGRYYIALLSTPLSRKEEKISVECYLTRNPNNRLKMMAIKKEKSRYSKSEFTSLLTSQNNLNLIGAKLYTGRTHQIRVHLEYLNRHIIGDNLYGLNEALPKEEIRIMLHAYLIEFKHPKSEQKLCFKVPLLKDMLEYLKKFFDKENLDEILDEEKILHAFNTK
ncbi:RluA family pseudouridine synthase [Helicobacter acinonychis]|uniref:Pseudouridine synthase n=1 Tax=Helicobacter acinonychis (strain Sheeba) TaxID=382638 RepID=Q17XZ9_HELAH|nr:RluA family pseudouridine synthase [Helicobacter acinonychis]CAJ99477.1 pseudouridine synthase [Helicobacter acinonychis str. Sheeba]STP04049.1 pseudouridine synthase [Helicobacter acinonychis]